MFLAIDSSGISVFVEVLSFNSAYENKDATISQHSASHSLIIISALATFFLKISHRQSLFEFPYRLKMITLVHFCLWFYNCYFGSIQQSSDLYLSSSDTSAYNLSNDVCFNKLSRFSLLNTSSLVVFFNNFTFSDIFTNLFLFYLYLYLFLFANFSILF